MFRQRRLLKKEKLRVKIRLVFVVLSILLIMVIGLEFLYFNFARITVISPLAKGKTSKLIILENQLAKKKIN
ncbi:MAG: hypothetical protein ABSD69_00625, partial [Candidatus Levyibacteriota bacterium]